MTTAPKEKKPFKLFGMKWYYFAIFAAIVLITLYVPINITGEDVGVKTNLPGAMLGCFSLMILLGAVFNEIGNRTPIVKSYLGGGAIVCIFAASAMVYFQLFPTSLVVATPNEGKATTIAGNMYTFFASTGGFLDWYIAALICGSILGMNKKLLLKASARYLPAILGGVAVAFGLVALTGLIIGYGSKEALVFIGLPIMGGGMGAGAVPLSKIFDSGSSLSAAEALARMVPAVAIGNLFAIVMSGLLPKVFKGKGWNGQGALLVNKSNDPHEYDLSEEEMTKREKIDLRRMGIGLFVSGAFFCLGIIINKFFNMVLPDGQFLPKIHSYAWMIISVALCKVFGWLDEDCEIGCYQWFQFISKNLTPMLLIGIGACYVPLQDVISQFTFTYVVLCLVTVLGAVIGSGLIGKLVGFYPVESAITAGLCMANMGGTGDVACLSAADRMELMPFAQISSRIGGAIILLISSVLLSLIPV